MIKFTGKCLCKHIQYSYDGPTGIIVHCHCNSCRTWHGSLFRSRMIIKKARFKWISGKQMLSFYRSSKNVTKSFCSNCGSHLLSYYSHKPTLCGLPIGGLDEPLTHIKQVHIFTQDQSSTYPLLTKTPHFDTLPNNPTLIHSLMEDS